MQIFLPENIPSVVKASNTSLSLATTNNGTTTRINIGGQSYLVSNTITLNTGTLGANGMDVGTLAANTLYYMYLIVNTTTFQPALIISLTSNATGPSFANASGYGSAYRFLGKLRTDFGAANINTVAMDASIVPQGAVVGPWISYTPTIAGLGSGSTDINEGFWRRVGDSIEIKFGFRKDGTSGTGSTNISLSIPTGLTIDATKIQQSIGSESSLSGLYELRDGNISNTNAPGSIKTNTTTTVKFQRPAAVAASLTGSNLGNTGVIMGTMVLPIAEWAGLYT